MIPLSARAEACRLRAAVCSGTGGCRRIARGGEGGSGEQEDGGGDDQKLQHGSISLKLYQEMVTHAPFRRFVYLT